MGGACSQVAQSISSLRPLATPLLRPLSLDASPLPLSTAPPCFWPVFILGPPLFLPPCCRFSAPSACVLLPGSLPFQARCCLKACPFSLRAAALFPAIPASVLLCSHLLTPVCGGSLTWLRAVLLLCWLRASLSAVCCLLLLFGFCQTLTGMTGCACPSTARGGSSFGQRSAGRTTLGKW